VLQCIALVGAAQYTVINYADKTVLQFWEPVNSVDANSVVENSVVTYERGRKTRSEL